MSVQVEAVHVGLANKTTSAFPEGVRPTQDVCLCTLGSSKWMSDMSAQG